jgi:hypothetical protein
MSDRDLGEEIVCGASATWYAVARQTRNGARKGTVTSSFAERALQDSAPTEMIARPRSMASLRTTRAWIKSLSLSAKPKLRSVAQESNMASGRSTLPRVTSLAITTERDTAATQIGQLMPGSAEKRKAAPRAELRRAEVQTTIVELRIGGS